ncbi:MAG: ABC transporter substrate-binding protein [Clostridia bacterium]|nr:ABC transporter substrate-binding protein [Clostridia bacterium]
MRKRTLLRGLCGLLLLLTALSLAGCRTRRVEGVGGASGQAEQGARAESVQAVSPSESWPEATAESEPDPSADTRENPAADRREYDENADVDVVEGTDRAVHGEGEGDGAPKPAGDGGVSASQLNGQAEQTATQTVPAEEAERMGVSEDADKADSAMTYYTVLLQDRLGTLFECKRLTAYWETAEDHVTVFKTSAEHELILGAGAYDVSARLLQENLRVDDGWIARKDPQLIVKAVSGDVLGRRAESAAAASAVYEELLARPGWEDIDAVKNGRVLILSEEMLKTPHLRVAAMLAVAKTAYPDLFEDTDTDTALRMLAEEATGGPPEGVYYYGV